MRGTYFLETAGTSILTLAVLKTYLKVTGTSQDAMLTSMLTAANEWGEKYTGREFRDNTWKVLFDCFTNPLVLHRNPVDTITSVKHLVDGSQVIVDSADYYKVDHTQESGLFTVEGKEWPTDTDSRFQAVEVIFVTKPYTCEDLIKEGLLRHIAWWYANRGDCDDCGKSADSSGVKSIYNLFRIERV